MRVLLFAMALAADLGLLSQPASASAQNPEAEERGSTWLAGVFVSAEADMWNGPRLRNVIPLLVTIDNRSRDAVRLRYEHFRLMPLEGRVRMALPPSQVHGAGNVGTRGVLPAHPHRTDGFQDLPEGMLGAGERIRGFVYFENGEDPPNDTALFEMDVVQAATKRTIGTTRMRLEID